MDSILTQEELDAIYSVMQADSPATYMVDDYLFDSDHSYNHQCLANWKDKGLTIVPYLEPFLVSKFNVHGKLDLHDVRIIEDEIQRLKKKSTSWNTEVVPLAQTDSLSEYSVIQLGSIKLLLGMERKAALSYISRKIVTQTTENGADHQQFTVQEKKILSGLFIEIAKELETALKEIGKIKVLDENPETFWQTRTPSGSWVHMEFVFSSNNKQIGIWLKGPAELFRPSFDVNNDGLQIKNGVLSETKLVAAEVDIQPLKNDTQPPFNFLHEAPLELTVEVGRRKMTQVDINELTPGTVLDLNRIAGETLDVFADGKLIARGEAVLVGKRYGVLIKELIEK